LRILAREASGYHSIETLFQRIALHDVVTVRTDVNERILACGGPAMPAGGLGLMRDNLAWAAADLYARTARWDTGWDISIVKQIPVGGGLGGGSADAAAVLRAMDAMSPAPMGATALVELAGELGADVPFLVADVSRALAWGRGDRMLTLTPLPSLPLVLFPSDTGVNTGDAYRAFAATRATGEPRGGIVCPRSYEAGAFDSWGRIAALAENDFEFVVPAMHAGVAAVLPRLKELASELRALHGPAIGMLSGSGATCFLLADADVDVELPGVERRIVTRTL
jgi:4-diphosphocytidyl-2-C-methyl-D-erythritol kinase